MSTRTRSKKAVSARFFTWLLCACFLFTSFAASSNAESVSLADAIDAEFSDSLRTEYVLSASDHTADSWAVYTDAIAQAIYTEQMPDASAEQQQQAIAAIESARSALVFAAQADLDSAIADADAKDERFYTPQSWAAFSSALAQAYAMPQTSNLEVSAKASAINAAASLLVVMHHSVTFDSQGGSTLAGALVAHGEFLAVPQTPVKDGQTFYGWFTDPACTALWDFDASPVTGDMVLYAKWQADMKPMSQESYSFEQSLSSVPVPGGMRLFWNAAPGATHYQIYQSTSAAGKYKKLREVASLSYTASRLKANTQYFYKVRVSRMGSVKVSGDYTAVVSAKTPPVPPKKLNFRRWPEQLSLSWSPAPGASGYEVYVSDTKAGAYTQIADTGSTAFVHTGLSAGKIYYYKIRAYYTQGEEKVSGHFCGVKAARPKPPTPANVTAQTPAGGIMISWDAVPGASRYEIYRGTSANGKYRKVREVSTLSFTNTGLKAGTQYFYKVRVSRMGSVKVSGDYTAVVSAKTPPVPPKKLNFRRWPEQLSLSWSPAPGASGYEVYVSDTKAGAYTQIADTGSTAFVHTGLSAGKIYYYKIRAYYTQGEEKVSGHFCGVKAARPKPPTPANVTAQTPAGGIMISWDAVPGASRYEIYRGTSANGKYRKVREVSTLSFTNTGLKAGTQYFYKVRVSRMGSAKNAGDFSYAVTAKMPPAAPAKPKAVKGSTLLTLSWRAAKGAAGYEIESANTPLGSYSVIADTAGLNYLHTGLAENKTYYYRIRAYFVWNEERVYGKYTPVFCGTTDGPIVSNAVNGRVELIDWFAGGSKIFPRGQKAVVIDVDTGLSFDIWRLMGTNHADCEPLTKQDTATMKQINGGTWSHDRRAIWVKIGDRYFAASMYCLPHDTNYTKTNGMNGHFCIHFYKSFGHSKRKPCPIHQSMIQKAFASAHVLDAYLEIKTY